MVVVYDCCVCVCVCARVFAFVCVFTRAFVRACVCACMRACVGCTRARRVLELDQLLYAARYIVDGVHAQLDMLDSDGTSASLQRTLLSAALAGEGVACIPREVLTYTKTAYHHLVLNLARKPAPPGTASRVIRTKFMPTHVVH